MSTMHGNSAAMAARDWAQTLVPYRRASAARAILELAVTVLPFIALWTAMVVASRHGQYWLSFVMAPFAAGLLVRLFMIQHDCGHGAFLPSKIANDWIGRAIGVVTMISLRSLAEEPRDPSCDIGKSRPARHRRHQDADCSRVFVPQLARPPPLPALSSSPGDVRGRADLSFPDREPLAFRLHAQGLNAVA